MSKQDNEQSTDKKDRHPLITVAILTAGTQLGSSLIQRMGRQPILLFAMGFGAGVYTYKNRKAILAEAKSLSDSVKQILPKQSEKING